LLVITRNNCWLQWCRPTWIRALSTAGCLTYVTPV